MNASDAGVEVGLAFGSNLGDKVRTIRMAAALLVKEEIVSDLRMSSLYRTAPWGHVQDQDWFVNGCALGRTHLSPADLLCRCKSLERRLGRTETVRWGPRVIDIDLLFYGDLSLRTPGLTLPHKDMMRRSFVLTPLAELCPSREIDGVSILAAAQKIGTNDIQRLNEVA